MQIVYYRLVRVYLCLSMRLSILNPCLSVLALACSCLSVNLGLLQIVPDFLHTTFTNDFCFVKKYSKLAVYSNFLITFA